MVYCSIEKCDRLIHAKGYCGFHYGRFRKHGDPLATKHLYEKHGLYKHPLYQTWLSMKQRCINPKCVVYKYYGGRGIQVCESWKSSFRNFLDDMGERPSDSHTLDRINNDGNYEPANCRWATMKIQTMNRGLNRNNTSGYKGIRFIKGKWRVRIMQDYKEKHLGSFDSLEAAIIARKDSEIS